MRRLLSAAVIVSALFFNLSRADATPIELTINGTINASNMTAFPVSQAVTAKFVYESSTSSQSIQNQQAFFANAITSFQLISGGYNSTDNVGAMGQIDKYDGLAGTDGISFQVAAIAATYQFISGGGTIQLANVFSNSVTQTFDNMIINLARNDNTLWSNYNLPTSYNFSDFNQTQNALVAFSGGGFQIGWTSMTAVAVPEPAAMGLLAIAGMSLLSRRSLRLQHQ